MKLLEKLTRKNQSASISADDLFYNWNAEQFAYWSDIVGRWQAKADGKSGINTGLILNEVSLTELAVFTIPTTLSISSGQADKPDDFEYRISLRINGKKVNFIRPDQISYVNDSVIDAPSISDNKYYATEYQDYYSFLPSSVTSADLDYISSPTEIKWGYVYDDEGRQVYNPGLSVDPKWANSTIITITKRTLKNMGVGYKDSDFINAGTSAILTGN